MSVRRFKFVSPGVFIKEIDNSQLPKTADPIGPCVIGRSQRGPSLRPVTVGSMSEFVEIFGEPIGGGGGVGDVWREGNFMAPTYAAFAAQAYLRNSSPVTFVRLLGAADPNFKSGGEAGWKTTYSNATGVPTTTGGALGLFIFSSGSTQIDRRQGIAGIENLRNGAAFTTGSLAAVWYFDAGGIALSGTLVGTGSDAGTDRGGAGARQTNSASCAAVKASDPASFEFTGYLWDNSALANNSKVVFNFNRNSDNYIRKVFNTNPSLMSTNTVAASARKRYFLGETFERNVFDLHNSTDLHTGGGTGDTSLYGVVLPLKNTTSGTRDWSVNQLNTQPGKTGWFFSQDVTTVSGSGFAAHKDTQKLFRFVTLDDGAWGCTNLKISIKDIKAGTDVDPYGTFTVEVRRVKDKDSAPQVIESYGNCNLNPNSSNFVATRIGDMYQEWDTAANRYRTYGQFPNQSRFIRVVPNSSVEEGATDPQFLPFGFYGPPRYKTAGISVLEYGKNKGGGDRIVSGAVNAAPSNNYAMGNTGTVVSASTDRHWIFGMETGTSASVQFPSIPMRLSSSDEGLSDQKRAYFGISTYRSVGSDRYEDSYVDLVRGGKGLTAAAQYDTSTPTENSFVFTLDDVCVNGGTAAFATGSKPEDASEAVYVSGSRALGYSYSARRNSWKDLLETGFNRFTSPIFGGVDGLDITEREPFHGGTANLGASSPAFRTNYSAHSIKRAVDSVADAEVVEINVLSVPGVRAPLLTNHIINTAEDRADCLAVVDPEYGGFAPSTETTDDFKTRITNNSVIESTKAIKKRGLNSSYGCAYFPWVKIYDEINDQRVWVPPSVVAIGTFGSVEANSELWFAPAGFTRGGLSEGSAGLPVVGVSQRLTSKDRDRLYENNINPIATFPAEGIVIFGQKTLQQTRSALDRINVRRLMIYLKKEISIMAARLLFDQNVQATWNRFRGQVEPFLDSVKARFGLTDYKVILDETTTTPDLVDRNIMYAKIFLKPARAIEFIAIDFVITRTGAAFED
mgnify:CR=1 FL=1